MLKSIKQWVLRHWTSGNCDPQEKENSRGESYDCPSLLPGASCSTERGKPNEVQQLPELGGQSWGSVMTGVFKQDYWRGEISLSTKLWRFVVSTPETSVWI